MLIREMKSELAADWFDFFDTRAFADHEDWKGCYCTHFFSPRLAEYEGGSRRRRDYAAWLVERGIMKGYLAYEQGRVVGWCNANEKAAFPALSHLATNDERVVSIACFLIQKENRGQGIAQKILDRIIEDAKKKNRRIIEAYPRPRASSEFGNYRGPLALDEKNGFKLERLGETQVARRYL